MNKFRITATHAGFGTVEFVIEAENDKAAFTKWKSVVFSGRQWVVKSNTPVGDPLPKKEEPTLGMRLQALMDQRPEDDL